MNASPLIIPSPLLSNFSASITNRQHPHVKREWKERVGLLFLTEATTTRLTPPRENKVK